VDSQTVESGAADTKPVVARVRTADVAGRTAVVLGAAGFVGSHLCDRLLAAGAKVIGVDNLATGRARNLNHLADNTGFRFVEHDIVEPIPFDFDVQFVAHLASPASPPDYLRLPIATLRVGSLGTENALQLADSSGARLLLASTSEVYGDPAEHPQRETYWGNVNPIGPRSVYDEAKRYAEALTMAYHRAQGTNVGIARIFNTYGTRMRMDDGRAIPEFIGAALAGRPLPVHGDGTQTRSLCYVSDTVEGLFRLLVSDVTGPVNIGNSREITMLELAETIQTVVGVPHQIDFQPRPVDDPTRRCPDTTAAKQQLGWSPQVSLEDGLARTVAWFRAETGR
jgi:dTDP-glucose 4,6-dehydratase